MATQLQRAQDWNATVGADYLANYQMRTPAQIEADALRAAAVRADNNWWDLGGFGSKKTSSVSGTSGRTSGGTSGGTDAKWPDPTELQGAQQYFDQGAQQYSYYTPMAEDEQRRLAEEFGQMYSAPQYSELERKLEQAIADAQAQEERIRAGFAGTQDAFARREEEQARRDLESAIARGAGRSGVVPWLSRQRQEHFNELLAAEEAKKNAELYAVANQLGLVQRQVPDQRQQIAEQTARLVSQELQRLQDLDYARAREYDIDQWERMLNTFDRTMLTPVEQLQLYLQMAETAGKFPESAPSIYGTFSNGGENITEQQANAAHAPWLSRRAFM